MEITCWYRNSFYEIILERPDIYPVGYDTSLTKKEKVPQSA